MSYLSELDSSGFDQRNTEDLLSERAPIEHKPGFFQGIVKGPAAGFMRGLTNLNDLALTATDLVYPMSDEERDAQAGIRRKLTDYFTPDANTVGTAGRVLGGVTEGLAPLVVPGAGPALMVGSNTLAAGKRLVDQGVDSTTAGGVAALEGAASYAGLKLPILGSTLGQRLAAGAVGNLALGAGSTEADRALLDQRGYAELAKNYDPGDVEARAVDVLSGLVFGGLHHLTLPSQRDAVATLANAKHFQKDTAPGIPADPQASAAHQRAMETATEQTLRGEPVNVDPEVTRANFEPRNTTGNPIPEELKALDAARATQKSAEPSAEPAPVGGIERGPGLSPVERAIETRFAEAITTKPDELIDAYSRIEGTEGGNVINADIVRELSPDYLADRSKARAVHEPASFLTKEIYRRKLAKAEPGGEVIFAAGGAGSGKSTGLDLLGAKKSQIVYDGTLSKMSSATKIIDQALAAGQTARVAFTYRDPVEAFKNGVLPRSAREEAKFGTGRTVPLEAFEHGHKGAREVLPQLMEKYKNDPRVKFTVIDNSRGQGEARIVGLDELPATDYNGVRGDITKILEEARRSGSISDAIYHGTRGQVPAGEHGRVQSSPGGEPQSQRAQESADQVDEPIVAAARQQLAESDVQIPTGEVDAQGNPIVRSAREALAEADSQVAEAQKSGQGIAAAVSCFITRGA